MAKRKAPPSRRRTTTRRRMMREADEEEEKEEKDDDETTLMKLTVAQLKERLRSNGLEAEKGWKKKDFVASLLRGGGGGGGGRRRFCEKDFDDATRRRTPTALSSKSNNGETETSSHPFFGRLDEDEDEDEEERRRRRDDFDDENDVNNDALSSSVLIKRATAKRKLIESCRGTYRGALFQSSPRETKRVFDAKRELEKYYDGKREEGKMDPRLRGRWKLIYTTAVDVTGLLVLSIPPPPLPFLPPPPIVVGDIYQEFKTDTKEIVNEIRASVPALLEEKDGVVLRVNATYKDRSSSNKTALELVFQEAVVSDVRISEFTEMLLAPAVLPRGELNQRVLLFLRDFEVRFPLFGRAATAMGGASNENERNEDGKITPGASVGKYEFSYCDEDVLIGKATGSQGIFIFTKEGDQSEQ
mmetsp:Transcript_7133/g.21559  ORF Transcript_7133/g.21559 Transcript_7133/m.21559 type:complete len:415 (+) Transcript_7133:118-1362(+)